MGVYTLLSVTDKFTYSVNVIYLCELQAWIQIKHQSHTLSCLENPFVFLALVEVRTYETGQLLTGAEEMSPYFMRHQD